jgi:hypothetical protein
MQPVEAYTFPFTRFIRKIVDGYATRKFVRRMGRNYLLMR